MTTPPQGKISRLPHHLREQIHLRLRDGQKGGQIVAWLNSSPEVRQVLATAFAGHSITQPNLSEWKKRHHPAWLLQQDALAQAGRFLAESREIAQAGQGALTDHLATFVAARYALAIRELHGDADGSEQWNRLRALCHDVAGLRRNDQRAEWLRINRERLQMQESRRTHQNPMSPITPIPPIQA
jgi:hypothetical protein